jgi:hypothetical protein
MFQSELEEMQGAFLSDHLAQKRLSAYLEKHLESSRLLEESKALEGQEFGNGGTFACK